MRNGIVAECYEVSDETVALLQCEQLPEQGLSSSAPTIEEEEEETQTINKIDNDSGATKEGTGATEGGSGPTVICSPQMRPE